MTSTDRRHVERRSEHLSRGEQIRRIRKSLHLTQIGLARRLGVSQPSVAKWERNGPIDEEHLAVIAALADLPITAVTGEASAEPPPLLPESTRPVVVCGYMLPDGIIVLSIPH